MKDEKTKSDDFIELRRTMDEFMKNRKEFIK